MTLDQLLALDDDTLAVLYSDYSEDTMAAGWDPSLAVEFVDHVVIDAFRHRGKRVLTYELETLAEIRAYAAKLRGAKP